MILKDLKPRFFVRLESGWIELTYEEAEILAYVQEFGDDLKKLEELEIGRTVRRLEPSPSILA